MSVRRVTALGLCLVLCCLIAGPVLRGGRLILREHALQRYERFLAEHPYSRRSPDSDGSLRAEHPGARFEQEYLMTMDPVLGRVPPRGLFKANERADKLRLLRRSGKSAGPQLVTGWTERGPNNVGGRTRAIMFDPNDVTHKRVYAGGVDGFYACQGRGLFQHRYCLFAVYPSTTSL